MKGILMKAEMVKAILDGRKKYIDILILSIILLLNPANSKEISATIRYKESGLLPAGFRLDSRMVVLYKESGMTNIILNNGVKLKSIPVSPNDKYMAGNDGYIYSYRNNIWKRLLTNKKSQRYQIITLCDNGKKITKPVHRLICMSFHGMPQNDSMQTRHLDGNRNNNKPDNLAWGTIYDNWKDRKLHGRCYTGEQHPTFVLTYKEREHLKWAIDNNLCSRRHAGRVLNISSATINRICKEIKK